MTNKQLYNLVFENFVQAKKELIREGYTKKINEIDFNEVFNKTKQKLAEEKIKSLKRENEMLRNKLSKRQGLKEEDTSGGKLGAKYQQGSKAMNWLFDLIDKGLAATGDKGSILVVIERV